MSYLREEFKPVVDETGILSRYIISNYGRVYDTKADNYIAQVLTGNPQYFYVNYYDDTNKRKLRRVHNLLARTWIDNPQPDSYNIVDHIDKNKYNNCIDNLRWTDRTGNANNTTSNIMVGDSVLTSYCRDKYKDNYLAAVGYISRTIRETGISSEQATTLYDSYLHNLSTQHELFIEHKGQQLRLKDYCEELNIDYPSRKRLYNQGESEFHVKLGIAPITQGYEYKYNDSVSIWSLTKYMQGSKYRIPDNPDLAELISNYSYEDYLRLGRQWSLGIDYKGNLYTLPQLLKLLNKSDWWYQTISKKFPDKNILELINEDAGLTRIRNYSIDGEIKPRRDWCLHFNLNPKLVGNRMSKLKEDFRTSLEYFGVDTANLQIIPMN